MKLVRIALIMVFAVGMVIGFNGVTWSSAKSEKHNEAVQKAKDNAARRGYFLTCTFGGKKKAGKRYKTIDGVRYVYTKMSDRERMNALRSLKLSEEHRAKKAEEVKKFLAEEKREKGEVSQGKQHTYYSATVSERKDEKLDGKVTLTFPGGSKYVGECKDGKRNGYGTHTWPDGSKYVGSWKDDKLDGQGTYTWANGHKYVGEWKDNKKNGQGTHTWPSGKKYEGKWRDGKWQGE